MLRIFLIVFVTVLTALVGSVFTSLGIDSGWYSHIVKPAWTPPGAVIGVVWTILYILTALSAFLIFRQLKKKQEKQKFVVAYLANAFLNIVWSYIFFVVHALWFAGVEALLLGVSVLYLIFILRSKSHKIAFLLYPYAIWVFFAAFLTFCVAYFNF